MRLRRALLANFFVVLMLGLAALATASEAQTLNRAGAELLSGTAAVGLRSPRPLDIRRFEGADIGTLRRSPNIDERALLRFLRQAEPNLARAVDAADPSLRRATLEALAGARAIERAIPANPLRLAEIVDRGGVELLRAAARPVDGLGDALLLLDGSMRAGRLPDNALARFGRALDTQGDAFAWAWRTHIVPNWELVVAGGLVTAFLIEPERFIDAAGRLTAHAVAAFTDLGIEVGASVAEGIWQGIWRSIQRRIEAGKAWTLIVPLVALATFAAVIIARRRSARRGQNHRKDGKSK